MELVSETKAKKCMDGPVRKLPVQIALTQGSE